MSRDRQSVVMECTRTLNNKINEGLTRLLSRVPFRDECRGEMSLKRSIDLSLRTMGEIIVWESALERILSLIPSK